MFILCDAFVWLFVSVDEMDVDEAALLRPLLVQDVVFADHNVA